jgi:hypothetical protein
MSDWSDTFYADVDAMRLEPVVDSFAPDGEMVFGNNPPAVGRVAVREMLTGFWSAIGGLRHEWRNRWTVDESTSVLDARVHYTTHGGSEVVIPCVTVIDRSPSGLITSLRIYGDSAPLFAAIGAESENRARNNSATAQAVGWTSVADRAARS